MTNLTNVAIQSGYGDLLTTTNNGQGLTNVLQQLQDGFGNASPITIATNAVNFNRQNGNSFQLDGISLTATATDINTICGALNGVSAGTGALSLPRGNTAQRPIAPVGGAIRFNTDNFGQLEVYDDVFNVWDGIIISQQFDILRVDNNGGGLSNNLNLVRDSHQDASPMSISTNAVNFSRQGGDTFQLDNVPLTAPAGNVNEVCQYNNFAVNDFAVRLPILIADPAVSNGLIYYNDTTNHLRACVNGAWVNLA